MSEIDLRFLILKNQRFLMCRGWFIILAIQEVEHIQKLSKKQFPKKEDYHDFLMMEIQKHLVEINDLIEKRDPHATAEMIDLSILGGLVALNDGADKKLVEKRFDRFVEKIKENL